MSFSIGRIVLGSSFVEVVQGAAVRGFGFRVRLDGIRVPQFWGVGKCAVLLVWAGCTVMYAVTLRPCSFVRVEPVFPMFLAVKI